MKETRDERIKRITVHDDKNVKGFFYYYRFLSNFYLIPVEYEGKVYPSSENAYQAAKCANVEDREKFINIGPEESKALGKKVEKIHNWDIIKPEIMYRIVKNKFTNDFTLRLMLLVTGERFLEETNYWGDTFWGVCSGQGLNTLGNILMRVRKELKEKK